MYGFPFLFTHAYQQIPNSHVASSVCYSLEAFMKLEKRLCEGHEGAVAMRGQPSVQEQRSRLEKLIKTWASMDIQVSGQQHTSDSLYNVLELGMGFIWRFKLIIFQF